MKNTGIWIDKKKAIIVTLEGEKETLEKVMSGIEDYHITSNKSSSGPSEITVDRKYLERHRNQLKSFFKDIVLKIMDSDALVIFGPAQTNEKFDKELGENYPLLSEKIKVIEKADSMTDNQVKAWVRDFYTTSK